MTIITIIPIISIITHAVDAARMDFGVMLTSAGIVANQFRPQQAVEFVLNNNTSTSPQSYTPRFCYFNFRYVTLNLSQVSGARAPDKGALEALELHSGIDAQAGHGAWASWSSDSQVLNRYNGAMVQSCRVMEQRLAGAAMVQWCNGTMPHDPAHASAP